MRCMTCARREIQKERFVRCLRFLIPNPGNRVFCHRVIEIKVLLFRHTDDLVVLSQKRIELTVFSAEKSPEIVEAERIGPAVKRARWPLLCVGREMSLANRGGGVTAGRENMRVGLRAGGGLRVVRTPSSYELRDRTSS